MIDNHPVRADIPQPTGFDKLDARVKVILTFAFILLLNLLPSGAWLGLFLFLECVVILLIFARMKFHKWVKRSLLVAPFILAALPLVFFGPEPVKMVQIGEWLRLPFSQPGAERFISIAIKAWISIQAAILLTETTPFHDVLTALQQLRMPGLLVAIMRLMLRYLFLVGDEATRLMRARASRSAALTNRQGGNLWWRAKTTGGMAGSLFLRSIERSERVYAAMAARGYSGELPASEKHPMTRQNKLNLAFALLVLFCLWGLGIIFGG